MGTLPRLAFVLYILLLGSYPSELLAKGGGHGGGHGGRAAGSKGHGGHGGHPHVNGHGGAALPSHMRTVPDSKKTDHCGTDGNTDPCTDKEGTGDSIR